MLDKQIVINKMKERGFIQYASINKTKIQFVSDRMYDVNYENNTPIRDRIPIINIIVDLENNTFSCIYNVNKSTNTLNSSICGSIMNDEHFDNIVGIFELQAKWLERIF